MFISFLFFFSQTSAYEYINQKFKFTLTFFLSLYMLVGLHVIAKCVIAYVAETKSMYVNVIAKCVIA